MVPSLREIRPSVDAQKQHSFPAQVLLRSRMSTSGAQVKDVSRVVHYHAGIDSLGDGLVSSHREGASVDGSGSGGAGIDEVLANAGYSVSNLDDVAQKLEQLETVVGAAQEGNFLQLLNEVMHNNPADVAAWIETMIKELSAPQVSGSNGMYTLGGPTSGMSTVPGGLPDARSPSSSMHSINSSSSLNLSLDPNVAVGESQNCVPYASKLQGFHGQPNMFIDKYEGSTGIPVSHVTPPVSETGDQQWQAPLNQLSHNYYHSTSMPGSPFGGGVSAGGGSITGSSMQDGSMATTRPLAQQVIGPGDPSQQPLLPRPHQQNGMPRSMKSAGGHPAAPHIITDSAGHHSSHLRMLMEDAHSPMVPKLSQELGASPAGTQQVDALSEQQEESGVRLVHLLVTCAHAVQANNMIRADETVRQIQELAPASRGNTGPMEKVAVHFGDALARRIYGSSSQDCINGMQADCLSELLHFQFYEICPYLKFAHFTANQAILEAFEGEQNVHIIDFNLMHGLQWPALIQALALRPGGPPFLRLTGIGLPQPGGTDVLQEIGTKLAQLAGSVNVKFDFRGVVAVKLDDVKPWMLQVRPGEAVAVNSVLQLHRLLGPLPEEGWQMGNSSDISAAKGPAPAITEVLQSVRSLNPKIVTLVEHEANHNSPVFIERFMEALHYYSTMFDSLEACNHTPETNAQVLAEMYLGREICNIVACEGPARVERHETLSKWQSRMCSAGFQSRHLGSNAYRQASMLLSLYSAEGYSVEETNGFLLLKWHERPLMAASAWHCTQ